MGDIQRGGGNYSIDLNISRLEQSSLIEIYFRNSDCFGETEHVELGELLYELGFSIDECKEAIKEYEKTIS